MRAVLFASLICFAGCTATADGEDVGAAEEAATAGPPTVLVDANAGDREIRARAANTTVWIATTATTKKVGADTWVTMRFRTSRSIASAMSWVPDDGFGEARVVSPRVVEVDLRGGHEVNSILSGLPLFVHLTTTAGEQLDVRLDLATRLDTVANGSISVADEVRPVYVKGGPSNLRYRGAATASGATSLSMTGGATMASTGPGAFRFDWEYDALAPVLGDVVRFDTTIAGSARTKAAHVEVAVARAGVTTIGADAAWPIVDCATTVKSCLRALNADPSACGDYREVSRCMDALACSFQLFPHPTTGLSTARTAFNNACGSACNLTKIRAFDPGGCPTGAPTIDDVTPLVQTESSASDGGIDWIASSTLDRAALAQRPFFATAHGAALLTKLDTWIGASTVHATELVENGGTRVRYVLFYASTQTAVVLDGTRS